jgi:hypothetical chaperone protein
MQHASVHVGIDFGTTNTAVGLARPDGAIELAALPGPGGEPATTWRTILYFEPGSAPVAGTPAIDRYLEAEGEGRLVQSMKSHLASASFTKAIINGRPWTLEQLVASFLADLRRSSPVDLGSRAVFGRPVRYWGAEDQDDDDRAVARMRRALAAAGFTDVVLEYEPIAAALRYAATLDHDELIMVADFGGGTSDFSLIRVGPGVAPGDPKAILATGGIGIGGDSFDADIIDHVVAPALGLGTSYKVEMGGVTPVPRWLYSRLRRWHQLSFLRDDQTLRLLDRVEHGAMDKPKVDRLIQVVREDLGLPLHRAVERTKVGLSSADRSTLSAPVIELAADVARADFESWIDEDLVTIDGVVDRVLADAGVAAGDVDIVFATGGSSLVPAVRARLAARFGAAKLAGGEELTSVAWGLAARARQLFA